MQTKLSPAKRIDKAMAQLIKHPEMSYYFAYLTMGNLKADSTCKTAYTNGRDIAIAPEFVDWCTDKELVFVLLHEAEHIALMDFMTMAKEWKEDPQLTNAACDYAINLFLYDLSQRFPTLLEFPRHKDGPKRGHHFGLLDEQYRDMSAKEIYRLLQKQAQSQPQAQPQQGDGQGQGQAGQGQGQPQQGDGKGSIRDHIDANQWDEHGFDAVDELSATEKDELADDVKSAIAQGGVLASRAGSKSDRRHDAIMTREIPWHEVMIDFVKTNMARGDDMTTWRQYKRSMIGQDIYLPSMYSERINRLVVARDTSGSIGQATLNAFNGYLINACEEIRPEEVIVLDWGSSVVNDERYNAVEGYDAIKDRTRVYGGGGTSPECIGAYLVAHNIDADCLIVLTDGMFSAYDFVFPVQIPTLWCVDANYWSNFRTPFGQAVKVKV